MISRSSATAAPVRAKLLVDMVFDRTFKSAGDIVEMTAREFKRFSNTGHVEAAPAKTEKKA